MKRSKHAKTQQGTLTRAITHTPLQAANRGKLSALDALWDVYKGLCQQYVTYFCTEIAPDPTLDFVFASVLSARWQRVAVQQAAGMAQSWRSNHNEAYADYAQRLVYFESLPETKRAGRKAPVWKEWTIPVLKAVCIQANANVALRVTEDYDALALLPAEKGQFDYWLRVSTLDKGQPIYVPVRLAAYHREALAGLTPNSSMSLNKHNGKWWLTLTVATPLPAIDAAARRGTCGADVGIRNYVTDSHGKRYGGVEADFAQRVKRVQDKTSRKAKLRDCLQKKGVTVLPSTASAASQRLSRQIRQDINRAVNCFLDDHQQDTIAIEALSVASMRFKAKRMKAYLKASNLSHVLKQLKWGASKRGILVVSVNPAYSSQECPRCHFAARANRPNQQTFCCQVCGYADHADVVAACNLERRLDDSELQHCRGKEAVKTLLDRRHARWQTQNGCP